MSRIVFFVSTVINSAEPTIKFYLSAYAVRGDQLSTEYLVFRASFYRLESRTRWKTAIENRVTVESFPWHSYRHFELKYCFAKICIGSRSWLGTTEKCKSKTAEEKLLLVFYLFRWDLYIMPIGKLVSGSLTQICIVEFVRNSCKIMTLYEYFI